MNKTKAVVMLGGIKDTLERIPMVVVLTILHYRAYHTSLIVEKVFDFFSKKKGLDEEFLSAVVGMGKEAERGEDDGVGGEGEG